MSWYRPLPPDRDPLASALMAEIAELRESGHVDGGVARALTEALFDPVHDIVSRSGKGFRARVLEHAWAAAGGPRGGMPKALPVTIELLHVGSLVIDDIEDDSAMRRGQPTLHRRYGLPLALNTGNWLYFAALSSLSRLPIDRGSRLALIEDVVATLLKCHQGQALDISVRVTSLPRAEVAGVVSTTTELKTGALMGFAAVLGARCAGASDGEVERIRTFGTQIGIGLQMLDDWSGVHNDERRNKGLEDLRLARPTWPWAWLAEHADQLSYAGLARSAREASIEWEVDRVRERIADRLASVAPARIDAQLEDSVSILRSDGIDASVVSAVESDVEALARAYG